MFGDGININSRHYTKRSKVKKVYDNYLRVIIKWKNEDSI